LSFPYYLESFYKGNKIPAAFASAFLGFLFISLVLQGEKGVLIMAKISININSGSIQKEDPIVGIDLGTTNSLVAIIDKDSKEAKALKGKGQSVIVPSLLHFGTNDEIIVGQAAREFLMDAPERTVYSVKRLMGKAYGDIEDHASYFSYKIIDQEADELVKIRIGNKFYSPIELSSFILKELKYRAEQELGTEVKRAVITVPAYFNDSQRQATRDAGKLAGLEVLRIVNEPTAASLAYGIGIDKDDLKHVAVYDLGGGTFDVSILRITQGIFEVLSTHGDTYLGGDDFDRAIYQYWQNKLGIAQLEGADIQSLRLSAEEAKKALTNSDSFTKTLQLGGKEFTLNLDKAELKSCIAPVLERTKEACLLALKDSGITLDELDEVVLVGGSTRTPAVKEAVQGYFPNVHINDQLNPDEVVALGAAVEADILAGNR